MAAYKVIHAPETYQTSSDVENVICYITSPGKTHPDGIIGGAVLPEIAADAMNAVTDLYHKETGPRLRNSVLSFPPEEPVTVRQVKEIAKKCIDYYKGNYQILAAVHEDCDHLHIHFAMNTASYVDGIKYPGTKADYYAFLKHLKQVVRPYGIEVEAVK